MSDIDDIRERDRTSGSLWFTGPASFTAQAARDRRTLLAYNDQLRDLLGDIYDDERCRDRWDDEIKAALAGATVQPSVAQEQSCYVAGPPSDATSPCRGNTPAFAERRGESAFQPSTAHVASDGGLCIAEGGALHITITRDALRYASENHPSYWNDEAGRPGIRVTDVDEWASSVARRMNDEREDGSTLLTDCLDLAVSRAYENGEEGAEQRAADNGDASA